LHKQYLFLQLEINIQQVMCNFKAVFSFMQPLSVGITLFGCSSVCAYLHMCVLCSTWMPGRVSTTSGTPEIS